MIRDNSYLLAELDGLLEDHKDCDPASPIRQTCCLYGDLQELLGEEREIMAAMKKEQQ